MSSQEFRKMMMAKCDRSFFPARGHRAKTILSFILTFPQVYISKCCTKFYVITEHNEHIGDVVFMDYLCEVSDKDFNIELQTLDLHKRLTLELLKLGVPCSYFNLKK